MFKVFSDFISEMIKIISVEKFGWSCTFSTLSYLGQVAVENYLCPKIFFHYRIWIIDIFILLLWRLNQEIRFFRQLLLSVDSISEIQSLFFKIFFVKTRLTLEKILVFAFIWSVLQRSILPLDYLFSSKLYLHTCRYIFSHFKVSFYIALCKFRPNKVPLCVVKLCHKILLSSK